MLWIEKPRIPVIVNIKMLSEITPNRYESTIDFFEKKLRLNTFISTKILHAFLNLKETCNDFDAHQLIWATNVHFFPDNFIQTSSKIFIYTTCS